jgi:hypothetical protein
VVDPAPPVPSVAASSAGLGADSHRRDRRWVPRCNQPARTIFGESERALAARLGLFNPKGPFEVERPSQRRF